MKGTIRAYIVDAIALSLLVAAWVSFGALFLAYLNNGLCDAACVQTISEGK